MPTCRDDQSGTAQAVAVLVGSSSCDDAAAGAGSPSDSLASPGSSGSDGAMPVARRLAITTEATTIAMAPMATPARSPVLPAYLTTLVAISSETRFMTLISGLIAGPAVS